MSEVAKTPQKRAKVPAKPRISKKAREALRIMAQEGRHIPEAAQAAGLSERQLQRLIHIPEAKALHNQYLRELREGAASRAIARMERIAEDEENPGSTRADALKWLAGIEGISPITKAQVHTHHSFDYGFDDDD